VVKLAREGVLLAEGLFHETFTAIWIERERKGGRKGWVSSNRGLDPYHCFVLHWFKLL
jgi:hypothetical protein